MTIECVINVSEGRDPVVLKELAAAASLALLDVHSDPDHNRSVFTLGGAIDDVTSGARSLAVVAVQRLDLRGHQGAHPRLGLLDVVPFVPFTPGQLPSHDLSLAVTLRDAFAPWLSDALAVPSFLYGPLPGGQARTLPQVRKRAFTELHPDFGPDHPHATAGSSAVGARPVLVAYNVWVSSVTVAQQVAPLVRGPFVRALGLAVGDRAQVSCNLVDPARLGPAQIYDKVRDLAQKGGGAVIGAELVGLIPHRILVEIPPTRWTRLGLSADATVESRLRT